MNDPVVMFERLNRAADGCHYDQVVDAGMNLVINAFCQSHSRDEVECAWDQMIADAKCHLMECYDATGRIKNSYHYYNKRR